MASLQQHLSKLDGHGPVQLYAVTAVFDTIADAPASTAEPAIQRCLSLPDRPAVGVATEKMLALVQRQKLSAASVQSLLLIALSVSTPATASPLAACAVDIFTLHGGSDSGSGSSRASERSQRNTAVQNWTWRSHPLTKIVLASPYAGPAVVSSICQHLAASATSTAQDGASLFNATLASMRPFILCALLDRHLAVTQPQLATVLRTALVRQGSSLSDAPIAQNALLSELAAIVPALPVKTAQDQEAAACFVGDVIDLLEACEEEPDEETVRGLSCSLVELCCEILGFGGNTGEMIGALAVLAKHWPEDIAPAIAVDLVRMVVAGAGGKDELTALSLLCTLLESTGEVVYESPASERMCVELLPQLAFSQINSAKQWINRVLALLAQPSQTAQQTSGMSTRSGQVPATSDQAAVALLRCLWNDSSQACRWLQSVQNQAMEAAEKKAKTSVMDSSTASIIFSLLHHPECLVQEDALETALAAVQAYKSTSPSPSSALVSTLYALPHLARHPSAMPFIVRALHPLLAPTAPPLLQAVALRMLCTMWTTTGRGFPHLRAGVLSYAGVDEAGSAPKDPALRRAWAATLSDICTHSGEDKAGELVHAVFMCLKTREEEDPCAAAAGLECVAALCESDTLDFYKAWSIVRPLFPTLPTHPNPASAWVRLLASGGLDADFHPEIARGVVDALWAATGHASPLVRKQAYASLAAFNMGVLQTIDALSPLCDYAALLQLETDPLALEECEDLVVVALRREHATRRRPGIGGSGIDRRRHRGALSTSTTTRQLQGDVSGVLLHRLSVAIPKLMLGVGGNASSEFLRRVPDVPPPATLFFWAPPLSPQQNKAAMVLAAKEASTGYAAVFDALCGLLYEPMFTCEGSSGAAAIVAAWTPFMRRWSAAHSAAIKGSSAEKAATSINNAYNSPSDVSASALWEVIHSLLLTDPSVPRGVNATWAAATLCTANTQPAKSVVPAVHAALRRTLTDSRTPGTAIVTHAAAVAALGHCIDAVRVVVGLPAAVECIDLLCSWLQRDILLPCVVQASCAIGLGLACKQLCKAIASTGVRDILLQALGALLGIVERASSSDKSSELGRLLGEHFMKNYRDLGDRVPPMPQEVVDAALHALSDAMPAVLALDLPQLASVIQTTAVGMLQQAAPSPAACAALQAATPLAYKCGLSSSEDVVTVMRLLLRLMTVSSPGNSTDYSTRAAPNGRLIGAAAAALGSLIPALVREGFAFDSSAPTAHECLKSLVAVVEGAERFSGVAAAKAGAACGIAALLRGALTSSAAGYGADAAFAAMMKEALDVLEALALKDTNPRTKRACSWVLAELSWHIRQQDRESGASSHHQAGGSGAMGPVGATGASSGTAGTAGTLPHIKGLGALPEDGALRFLSEAAVTGTWPSNDSAEEGREESHHSHSQGAEQPLTALHAEVVVRCIAAAARLPALDWTSVCRRLLRAYPGNAKVQESCIELAAVHAAVSPAYQLYDFVSGDLLSTFSLRVLDASSQATVLKSLPELLAAVPLDEARGALRALCDSCPVVDELTTTTTTANELSWQTALAQGLARLAESPTSLLASDARTAALTRVLQKTPQPTLWDLQTGSNTTPTGSVKNNVEEQTELLWSALFQCAASLSTDEAATLCSETVLFDSHPVHYSWLAGSLVASGHAELRALQHSRNMVLNGQLAESPAKEESISLLITWALTLGSPASKIPLIVKQQWLVDVLGGAEKCSNPRGAVRLAVCGAVGIACAIDQGNGVLGGFHRAMANFQSAFLALPAAMARLAEAEAPPVGLLCSLVAALPAAVVEGIDCVWLQKRCCYSLRHGVAPDVWSEMYQKL